MPISDLDQDILRNVEKRRNNRNTHSSMSELLINEAARIYNDKHRNKLTKVSYQYLTECVHHNDD